MDRMSREIGYGGAFEAMWADMLGGPSSRRSGYGRAGGPDDLVNETGERPDACGEQSGECRPYEEFWQLSESLAAFVPFDLVEPPEPGTLQMQIRNDLKGLLASVWTMGVLMQEARSLEAKYSNLLETAAAEAARTRAAMESALQVLIRTLNDAPSDPGKLWPWVGHTLIPCVRTMSRMLQGGPSHAAT